MKQPIFAVTTLALLALAISVVGAMLLAQILLRPIHVIRSGLTRLGRGEFGAHTRKVEGHGARTLAETRCFPQPFRMHR